MSDKINTRDHNIEVLHDLGFQKERNTTVFKNGNKYILSPAVSEGSNGRYWFDVREINLNRINNDSLLLVRIVPDLFIIEHLKELSSLFTEQVMDNRPHSGNIWGIHIKLDNLSHKALLFNIKNPNKKILTKLLNKEELIDAYKEISTKRI